MAEPFDFQREHDGSLSLESAVFQALGAASVCWDNMTGTGVFWSERAKEIGDRLLGFIAARDLSDALPPISDSHTGRGGA